MYNKEIDLSDYYNYIQVLINFNPKTDLIKLSIELHFMTS